jgi:hypothetical protein
MYPNPLITPAQIWQKMEEVRKIHGATRPSPDAYWYKSRAPKQALWPWRKPMTTPTPEET